MDDRYVLRAGVGIIDGSDALLCIAPDASALRFDGDSVGFAGAALEILRAPTTATELGAELARRAGSHVDDALISDLLRALVAGRVVVTSSPEPRRQARSLEGVRVVLAVTGAVAAAEAPRTVLALQRRGATVRAAMSRAARRFVSRWTLEALTHEKVHAKIPSRDPRVPAPHIELGRWADAVLVAPATATTLSRVARGDCSDLVSAICVAGPAPVLLAPSMNERMLEAPSTQRNLEVLRADGFHLLRPSSGVEVADDPDARPRTVGAALSAEALVQAFDVWYQHLGRRRGARPDVRWDDLYRTTSAQDLPWVAEGIDEALRSLLLEMAPPPGAALDVGCGLGFQSRALAALGYATVGVDVSKEAILRAGAAALAPSRGAIFLHDDILHSKIEGRFDVVLDRGTFHSIPAACHASYAKSIARLTGLGSILAVVHDGPDADPRFSTQRRTHEEVEAAFVGFRAIAKLTATLRRAEDGKALCTVLRRTA